MEQITAGDVFIDAELVASYELTRTYHSRVVALGAGNRTTYRDLGGEGQAYIAFPEIFSAELRARLQRMIDAQVSLEERRRLRSEGGGVAVVLEQEDGSALAVAVRPPSFAHQPADRARFPASIAS